MKQDYHELEIMYKCVDIYALEVITGKWRLPIIWTLSIKGSLRYGELKREVAGITNIMLTRSLQGLEAFGLIKRIDFKEKPRHVEYSLTDKCREILPALEIINAWGRKLLGEYEGAKTWKELQEKTKQLGGVHHESD